MHKTGPVAPPIASRPAGTLIQELEAVFERRLDLTFVFVLDPGLPLLGHKPSCHVVVVVRIQDVFAPFFVLEPAQKVVALENLGSVGTSAPRHARGPAVNIVGR